MTYQRGGKTVRAPRRKQVPDNDTIARKIGIIKSIFTHAEEQKWIEQNTSPKITPPAKDKKK